MHAHAFDQFVALERDHWWFRGRRVVYLDVLRRALRTRPRLALDLGAGAGGWLAALGELADRVVALERDEQIARIARGRGGAQLVVGSANRLPLADGSCELVTAFDVIEHLSDDVGALREVRRVLAPDGLCALSVPAHQWLYSNNDRVSHHQRRYSKRALTRTIEASGLRVERVTYTNALLFPLIAPTVLGIKALERAGLLGADPEHTNLSLVPRGPLNGLCYRAFAAERHVNRRCDLPFGHSLLALARRG
ncbi:MAG: class I SAM-dependent methyltransferase [Planctomycetes bacterium]|nr:class I SAM-dependent methyltransferase [Planctomycetota bacterium]MCB9903610.1 class I SAM-dependent methyltransferase [Planctomycetota bacterium]